MPRIQESLVYDTLQLEGGLFVPAVLEKAARGEQEGQKTADYQLPKGLSLLDEQGRAFRIATALWKNFSAARERTDIDAARATAGFVGELLRDALGYGGLRELAVPEEIHDRAYPLSFMARGRVPVVVAPHDSELDEPQARFAVQGSGARRLSPFQLAQQFLNASEACLWAIAANGLRIRLLRDADTLTRPSFLEIDLETILREGRYADFSALWRLLHASRAGRADAPGADCIWERWKLDGHEQGNRVRGAMRVGVTDALQALGNGFLAGPRNETLRQRLQDGQLSPEAYFQQLLRLVYRFLFLFTVEERGVLHPRNDSPAARTARDTYARGYSMRRLRGRSLRRVGFDRHTDLWDGIRIVFAGLADGQPALALPALGGLFATDQCPDLDGAVLDNRSLLVAMRQLRWSAAAGHLAPVDYRNMGPEELGSVYESLLELIPVVDLQVPSFGFVGITDEGSSDGNARKMSGSYYTPDALVQQLLDSALDPVIEARLAARPDNPTAALLAITVVDPACGSGHFLLGAARRLAERLAELRAPEGAVRKEDYEHALREVIAHCLYGVDRNPMALELARTALWLEGYEPGRPLSFLDHHLVCGDALLGLVDFRQLSHGIPKDAFKPLSGDSKEACRELAAENTAALKALKKRLKDTTASLFEESDFEAYFQKLEAIETMPEDDNRQVAAKKRAYARFLGEVRESPLAHAADLFTAAFLAPKSGTAAPCPTTRTLLDLLFPGPGTQFPDDLVARSRKLCREAAVLHWPLAFAQVFGRGGFDCVLGNPPWERIKLQEQEYFAARVPKIAEAKNKAERSRRIQWLAEGSLAYHLHGTDIPHGGDPREIAIHNDFMKARRVAEAMSVFAHVNGNDGGRFALTGVGDVNTYALFAETNQSVKAESGRAGFIVPGGIATDNTTKDFFSHLVSSNRLINLFGFDNQKRIFESVHPDTPFVLMTTGLLPPGRDAEITSYLLSVSELEDQRRHFTLSAEDFALINPNTRTCPVFRSAADAELTKKIYRGVPVLIEEAREEQPEKNPWGIRFQRMLDMANDAGLFLDEPREDALPLYEAKMMHQFDHRWATYEWDRDKGAFESRDVTPAEKADPAFRAQPRYWVPEREVIARIARAPKAVVRAWLADDEAAQLAALANWIESAREDELLSGLQTQTPRDRVIATGGPRFNRLSPNRKDWFGEKVIRECRNWEPLSETELAQLQTDDETPAILSRILDQRSPKWLMGWRDITNATNERTMIASVIPRVGVGNKIPLFFPLTDAQRCACLLSNMGAMVYDFVARQKIGGTTMNYYLFKQLPILPPDAYSSADLDFIVPRVLELTYTSHELADWARDLGYDGEPFAFDTDRRAVLRAELDAYYARLYGLTRDELRYILDPADSHGVDYPTETFRGLKNKEIKQFGEYRTRRLVLEAWDQLARDIRKEPVEIALPSYPRTAFSAESIPLYASNLLYAWIRRAGGRVDAMQASRALSLLRDPARLVSNLDGSLKPIAETWQRSFNERVQDIHLRETVDDLYRRGQLRLTRDDYDHFHISLRDSAVPLPNIPKWTDLDAFLSLRSAQAELEDAPDFPPSDQHIVTFLAELIDQSKP